MEFRKNLKAHHTPEGFRNNYPHEERGFLEFLKWRWQSRHIVPKKINFPLAKNDPEFLGNNRTQPALTWIGHATFLLQFRGVNILTDPHFTGLASPVSWAGPKRRTLPGLPLEDLPQIDFVVISHNHYDHLDLETVKRIYHQQKDHPPRFFVPLGLKKWFKEVDIYNVVELDWWDNVKYKGWIIHAAPTQHFSGRSTFSLNKTLWAGWVLENADFKFFFVGDTGYSQDFRDIGERLGPIDLSAIPIGAYEPRWFMRPMHVCPEEAVKIHMDVKSRYSVGMHWGTFIVSDEDMDAPPKRLAECLKKTGISKEKFFLMQHGQTLLLDFIKH